MWNFTKVESYNQLTSHKAKDVFNEFKVMSGKFVIKVDSGLGIVHKRSFHIPSKWQKLRS